MQNKIDKLLSLAENNTMSDLFARYGVWLLMSISGKDEGSFRFIHEIQIAF
jgi:hypothetical protein